ncbi:hypothetical protein NC651_000320 [Populus alba x Populus x berolinensis]|nr:hypothetical protein NC651_000320 [Populus alba x Populus x berolinensis]
MRLALASRVQKLVTAIFTRLNPSAVKLHGRMRCKIRGITCRLNDTMTKLRQPVARPILLSFLLLGWEARERQRLLKLYNNHKDAYHFNPKVWVCLSTEFDVMRIAKAILESVTYRPCELKDFNRVKVKLREALASKRFLLGLDNSELLLEDDIWSVFVKHVLKDGDAGENLGLVRMKVVQKCCGLPMAARTLGGLQRSKPRDEWEKILDRKLWNLPDESDILPVMHDLVNDLARWAAGETYFGPEDEPEAHLQPEIYKRSRHSSYTRDDYDGIKNLKRLRVLSLSGYNISEQPSSIGELKLLRRKIGHGIEELMDLNFLCGTLCISRLENVVDHRRARQASLPEKQDLESLVLKWSSDITYSRDERIEKDVLDMLQPHQGLQELTINSYSSTEFPSWVGDPSFSNMVLLSLENCENCTSVPALGLLKSLKDLSITGMSGLQSIGREIYGECCSNPFPSLETIYFKDMPGWKYWHANGEEQVEVFPRLHKLSILNCCQVLGRFPYYLPSLEELVICESKCLSVSISSFPMLRDHRFLAKWSWITTTTSEFPKLFESCLRLVSFGAEEEGQDLKLGLPFSLEMLKFIDCESLQRPLVLHGLRSLEELHIEKNCPSLKCLSSRGKLPAPLGQLVIWDCPELGSIAETFCNMSPEKTEIKYCGKLACLPEGLNMLSHLQENTICNCSSILSFPGGGFPATSLRKLYMGWCEKLKALPERLRSLTSLVELDILTRPSIVSFPQEGFPTNLTSLLITNLNFCKPLFDWGLHRLASLTRLFITAGCPHILSFPCEETGMMLSTSLSSLSIVNFSNLQ